MLHVCRRVCRASGQAGNTVDSFMASLPRFFISLNGAAPVSCESLRLCPLSLSYASLAGDEAVLQELPGTVADVQHDTPVRLHLMQPNGTLQQVFAGRVAAPERTSSVSGNRHVVRVVGGLAGWADFTFTRSWSIANVTPLVALYRSRTEYFQNLKLAVQEVAGAAQTRLAGLSGWAFAFSASDIQFGASPIQPEAEQEGPNNMLNWLVKLLRPQADAWARFDHSQWPPRFAAGRFRDVDAQPLAEGEPPLLGSRFRRRLDQERAGVVIAFGERDAFTNAADPVAVRFVDPTGTGFNSRKVEPVVFTELPEAWSEGVARAIARNIQLPFTEGQLLLSLASDSQVLNRVRPGAVVEVDGVRHHVQSTSIDLATGVQTVSVGPPRQLGVQEITDLARWIMRAGKSASVL
jgi:hypothetical protein